MPFSPIGLIFSLKKVQRKIPLCCIGGVLLFSPKIHGKAVPTAAKHWFKWGNRLLWTRPINHDILSLSFMAFSLALFCWIQNFTLKFHEVQLIQYINLYLTTLACYRFFFLQEARLIINFIRLRKHMTISQAKRAL